MPAPVPGLPRASGDRPDAIEEFLGIKQVAPRERG